MHQKIKIVALAASLSCGLPAAAATPIQLKFEGLAVTTGTVGAPSTPDVRVGDFYKGGSSRSMTDSSVSVRAAPAAENFGTVFTGPAIATASSNTGGALGQFTRQRTLITSTGTFLSDELGDGALYADGSGPVSITLDPSLEFDTGLSFFYNGRVAISVLAIESTPTGDKEVTSGFSFPNVTPSGTQCTVDGNLNCLWQEAKFTFDGKAKSVTFSGGAFGFLLDNITLGGLSPRTLTDPGVPAIPEPSTYALMALGLAAVGFAARRRQQQRT